MQQEHLDEQMLKTGNVPTTDAVAHKMPSPAQQEREHPSFKYRHADTLTRNSCTSQETGSGGRRRGRAGEAASRDGHVGSDMHSTKRSDLQLDPLLIRFTGLGITRWRLAVLPRSLSSYFIGGVLRRWRLFVSAWPMGVASLIVRIRQGLAVFGRDGRMLDAHFGTCLWHDD